jgi:hypothetical protein
LFLDSNPKNRKLEVLKELKFFVFRVLDERFLSSSGLDLELYFFDFWLILFYNIIEFWWI